MRGFVGAGDAKCHGMRTLPQNVRAAAAVPQPHRCRTAGIFGLGDNCGAVPAASLREALGGPVQGLGCRVLVRCCGQATTEARCKQGVGGFCRRGLVGSAELS